jgi:single-strand DNA-binding protein
MYVNRIFLAGNLTCDPTYREVGADNGVTKFSIAMNKPLKGREHGTTFVDCEAWQKTATLVHQYFKKGDPIFLEGELRMDTWTDKATGAKRSRLIVTVFNFQFMVQKAKTAEADAAAEVPAEDAAPF